MEFGYTVFRYSLLTKENAVKDGTLLKKTKTVLFPPYKC